MQDKFLTDKKISCRVCDSSVVYFSQAKILNKHTIKYYRCNACGFIQTESPHWLSEAYSSAICSQDTGLMVRNKLLSEKVPVILLLLYNKNGQYLDYGGGYGIFVRMMRDVGFDFYWSDKYCQNLLAIGFEYSSKKNKKIELITSFETFEHFENPLHEIEEMLEISDNILFTTEVIPFTNPPKPNDWWYYSLSSGQHISFYSKESLEFIAKKYGLNFYSDGFLHLLTKKEITIPHKFRFCLLYLFYKYKKIFSKKNQNIGIFDFITKLSKKHFIKKMLKKSLQSRTTEDHQKLST